MENVPILLITVAPPSTYTPSSTTTSTTPSTTVSPSPSPSPSPSFFHIHSNLLLPFSPPFTRLFDALPTPPPGQWKALTISDLPAPIFASFVQWLYYGDKHFIALESAAEAAAQTATDSNAPSFPLALAQLCIVAERYEVTELRDAVVGEVASYWKDTRAPPPSGLVEYVYANTASGSVMRRLVVEWHGLRGDEWFASEEAKVVLERVPPFAGELAMALGMWHTRGGERLLIEGEEGGSREESLEEEEEEGDETSEEEGDETSEEGGSAALKAEMRGGSEGNETAVGSEGSEETLPG